MMSVDSNFHSLWANHPADETCIDSTDENALFHAMWVFSTMGGKGPETEPTLAIRRDILLSDQQDICLSAISTSAVFKKNIDIAVLRYISAMYKNTDYITDRNI